MTPVHEGNAGYLLRAAGLQILTNPPLNDTDWRGELLKDDQRLAYVAPPAGNANTAWRAAA